MRPLIKKLRSTAIYVLYLVCVVAAADYFFFYRPYVAKLRQDREVVRMGGQDPYSRELRTVRHVDRGVVKLLGKIDANKASSFYRFSKSKAPGALRICAFGDSYTQGDEVDRQSDYPSLLQGLFDAAGFRNVEVVNFGNGGYGFHQTYILWDRVGRHFDCDRVLLGPRGFQPRRDTSFGALQGWSPYYLHARYVLDGAGDVRLVEVPGDTYGERFDHYHRFLPPWRYLRYSRLTPVFLKAMIPKHRTLKNPFYYDPRSMDEEAYETYGILLSKMAAAGTPIFLAHHRREIVEIGRDLGTPSLASARAVEILDFPYLVKSHAGPLGNQLLAQHFFAHLTGRSDAGLTVLATRDLDWSSGARDSGPTRAMSSYSSLDFRIADRTVGRFVVLGASIPAVKSDAFLSLSGRSENVLDGCFLPLDLELEDGMEVLLRSETFGESTDYPFGTIFRVGGRVNLGIAKVEGFEFLSYKELLSLSDRGLPLPRTRGRVRDRGIFFRGHEDLDVEALKGKITVLVGDERLMDGEKGALGDVPGIWFSPVRYCRSARAEASGLVDLEALPDEGFVELVAEHWEDGTVRVPIARWSRVNLPLPPADNPLAAIPAIRSEAGLEGP